MALGSLNSRTLNGVSINSNPVTTVDSSFCDGSFNSNPFNHIAVNDCELTFYVGVVAQTVVMFSQNVTTGEVSGQIIDFSQDIQFQVSVDGQIIVVQQDVSTNISGQVVRFSEYVIDPVATGRQLSGYGGQAVYGE